MPKQAGSPCSERAWGMSSMKKSLCASGSQPVAPPACPPAGFTPYFMGWDASRGWAQPNSSVTIHHPLGDVKRIAYSYNPLQRGSVLVPEQTHYLVTWSNGSTQDGSSGGLMGRLVGGRVGGRVGR